MAANAVEDDPRTVAEETTDAKVAGIETIEAATEETVAMASAPDEALNAVGRRTEASVAPKGSAQVTHTTDLPEISEHLVRLNARKIEWT